MCLLFFLPTCFLWFCMVFFPLYNYWPSYLVYIVFLLLHCHFFIWQILIFSNILHFLVSSFSLNPTPRFQALPYFLLLPSVSSCCCLSSPLFLFFPAHFLGPCLICLIPPKWPISGSEVPHPNTLLETDLSPLWSTEMQLVLEKSNWGLTSEVAFERRWSSRNRIDGSKFLEMTRDT